ncbi:MAG: hypothetical protein AAF467_17775 [Actinomycetota bacterium]
MGTALVGSLILGLVDVRAATGAARAAATVDGAGNPTSTDDGESPVPTAPATTLPPAGSTLTTAAATASTASVAASSTTAPEHHDLLTPIETHMLPGETTSTLSDAPVATSTPSQLASGASVPSTTATTSPPSSAPTTATTPSSSSTSPTTTTASANPLAEPGFDDVRGEPTTTVALVSTTLSAIGPPVPAIALEVRPGAESGRRELRAGLFVTAREPVLAALTVDMAPSPEAPSAEADHQAFALRVENISTSDVPAPVVLEFGYEGFEPVGSFAGDSADNAWDCTESDERLRCVHDEDIEAAAVSVITVRTTVSGGPGTARTAAVYVLVLLVGLLASIINARSDSGGNGDRADAEANPAAA